MSDDAAPPPHGEEPEVGSVAEEAAKLLGAFATWAGDHGTDLGRGMAGSAGAAAGGVGDLARHLAESLGEGLAENLDTGAPECRWCPVCRTVHLVRELSPEVRDHLATAAASLMQAAAGVLTALEQQRGAGAPSPRPRPGGVERIDLDEPDDEPDHRPGDGPDQPEEGR